MVVNFDRFKASSPEDEPKPVFKCGMCEELIYEGEPFYRIGNLKICEHCNDGCREYAKED